MVPLTATASAVALRSATALEFATARLFWIATEHAAVPWSSTATARAEGRGFETARVSAEVRR